MPQKKSLLELSREQILRFRRRVCFLDERLPGSAKSFQLAAWAGLQDSMPRAALLSLHARVKGCQSNDWEHPSLVQLWGPRFNVYVVAGKDLPVFSLGRLPDNARGRARAYDAASRLQALLGDQRMPLNQAGQALSVHPNSLRYAAPTGTVLLRWDGARDAVVSCGPPPDMEIREARLELARRYLHVFGPGTVSSLARWAGIGDAEAKVAIDGGTQCDRCANADRRCLDSWPGRNSIPQFRSQFRIRCAGAFSAQRRCLLSSVGKRSRASRARSQTTGRAVDNPRLARRPIGERRDSRNLATIGDQDLYR